MTEDAREDRVRQAYSDETYRRPVKVKTQYDPGNMFRSNRNIAPGT